MRIGYKIKGLRTRQGITLKELAGNTGLTTSFLSQLERDITSPSLVSLEKIAKALNIKIGYFFEREEGKELVFIKKGMGKRSVDQGKKMIFESLASGILNIKMQPFIFSLEVSAELTRGLISKGGEKFWLVLKGKIEFIWGEEKMIFEEGDSIYCAYTQKPQRIINIGETEAKLLWIVFTPG